MDIWQFEKRKQEHIQQSLDAANQAFQLSGLEQVHLVHEALPDLNFQEITLDASCFGLPIATPFYVAGMTAGHGAAFDVNRTLALACQERGWAMGVGSQRRDLEMADGGLLDQWQKLREEVPNLILFANIGISQLITAEVSRIRKLVDDLGAQALVVHLNALQEVMQPEGTPQFRGGLETLRNYCTELKLPIILKETGCGFSIGTLRRVASIGLAAVDISGLGGTHWGRIEGARSKRDSIFSEASCTFANWGESTVQSVLAAVEALKDARDLAGAALEQKNCFPTEIWASGGVRSGLDAAKLIALGAHRVGYAQPALAAALNGPKALNHWMARQEYELKVALFCTGSKNCLELRQKEGVWRTSVI